MSKRIEIKISNNNTETVEQSSVILIQDITFEFQHGKKTDMFGLFTQFGLVGVYFASVGHGLSDIFDEFFDETDVFQSSIVDDSRVTAEELEKGLNDGQYTTVGNYCTVCDLTDFFVEPLDWDAQSEEFKLKCAIAYGQGENSLKDI